MGLHTVEWLTPSQNPTDKLTRRFHECLLRNEYVKICGPTIAVQSESCQ
jgi:hypothetical protein